MGHVPAGTVPSEGQGVDLPRRQHRRVGARRPALNRKHLAAAGEALAARFLTDRRAEILARNLQVGRGELDLVIAIGGRRIAVEVKTIQTGGLDDPGYAFTAAKAAQVRSLANQLGIERVDLVTVSMMPSGVGIRWVPEVA